MDQIQIVAGKSTIKLTPVNNKTPINKAQLFIS